MEFRAAYCDNVKIRIENLQEKISKLKSELNETQFNWKPAKKKWSIAECIDHLDIAISGYLKNLDAIKQKSPAQTNIKDKKYKPGIVGKLMLYFVNPEKRKVKIPSPGHFHPTQSAYTFSKLDNFNQTLEKLKSYTYLALNRDLNKTKVSSPVSSLLILKLGDVFEINIQHTERHLLQIEEIRNHPKYPTS